VWRGRWGGSPRHAVVDGTRLEQAAPGDERPTAGGRSVSLVPSSLRWRLAGSVAALIAISFGVTFAAVYDGTGSTMRAQIDRDMAGEAQELARTIAGAGASSPRALALAARRYVQNQPFPTSSTLLFVAVPGEATVTNQPELLGRQARPDSGETVGDQLRENSAGAKLLAPAGATGRGAGASANAYGTVNLPDGEALRLLRTSLQVPLRGASAGAPRQGAPGAAAPRGTAGMLRVTVGVGEPLAAVAHAQAGVAKAFIVAGIVVLVGALLAAYVLGTRFSRPLRRMATVAARVDAGDLHPRIHDLEGQSAEARVLAEAFNHMLDRLTEAFAAQRDFVADASHELRTPLTVLRGQIELLLSRGSDADGAQRTEVGRIGALVQAEIGRMSRLVEDLLVLARAERPDALRSQDIDLQEWLEGLWVGVGLLAKRRFELGAIPAGSLYGDPERLAQALRNVIQNAIEHTEAPEGIVRLSVLPAPGGADGGPELDAGEGARARFVVEDDGPGIPQEASERVFERFQRTDRARDRRSGGAGLGLAITRAIVHAHGGRVRAGASALGGARIEIELPGFSSYELPVSLAPAPPAAAGA
jgi:two-component system OmpR family sensor kinase